MATFRFNGKQEEEAVAHFRKLIAPWRREFTEDNWPTTADHLHELLHLALIAEGAQPSWIAFLADPDWRVDPAALFKASQQQGSPE